MFDFEKVPIGANKAWIVLCGGKPYAGADSQKEAEILMKHYAKNVGSANAPSGNTKHNWSIAPNK